jgi:PhzF family phenazine biosynthesis protein
MRKNSWPLYIVDAFTDKLFAGNPAAVCLLEREYADSVLQSVAAEMKLSETAFLRPLEQKPLKKSKSFSLRWFTPKLEVPLCGHATLAAAAVLFYDLNILADEVNFETKSGILVAMRDEHRILLDFPADETAVAKPSKALLDAIGIANFEAARRARRSKSLLIHVSDEGVVRNLRPDFELMKEACTEEGVGGIIVTSRGRSPYDFVSRFFAPCYGINEDPVTGAAHTVLAPYWSKILRKKEMLAYQASARGGKLVVRLHQRGRIDLIGNAVIVSKGKLYLQQSC